MSQSRQGNPRQRRLRPESNRATAEPPSAVVPHSRAKAPESAPTQLLGLALRLATARDAEDALSDALRELADVLPDCSAAIESHGALSDETFDSYRTPQSLLARCHTGEGRTRCEWQLGGRLGSCPMTLVITTDNEQSAALARQHGETVACLLSAFLRNHECRLELVKQRDKCEDFFSRAVQAEKLAGYGRIVASALHDLSNPLTAIVAYTNYLQRTLSEQTIAPADLLRLARIREAAERAHGLTHSLVEYARPAGAKPAEVDLASIIQNALVFCEHEFGLVGMQTRVDYDGLRLPILGIGGQLTQLFVNLFTNAAHAARETEAWLAVDCARDAGNGHAVVRVSDNGIGILPGDLEHVFDPFFTTKCDGRGLGLSIVRDIVECHGGAIRVESLVGSGTTFEIRLPTMERALE